MRKVYSSLQAIEIHNLKNVLENHGIECIVTGEYRRAAMGEIPISESFVELWVVNDEDEARAFEILGASPEPFAVWTCPNCGEIIEGVFDECWNCQTRIL